MRILPSSKVSADVRFMSRIKDRPSIRELDDWLATDEGKQATMFVPTTALRWGEVGRA